MQRGVEDQEPFFICSAICTEESKMEEREVLEISTCRWKDRVGISWWGEVKCGS